MKPHRFCSFAFLTLVVAAAVTFTGSRLANAADAKDQPIFDGKTIDGWKVNGGYATYKVEDGAIVGTTAEGSPNTFLCKGPFSDFVLEFEVLCDDELNSGVQIRSQLRKEKGKDGKERSVVYGYQCEIAPGDLPNCGNFWDEARQGKWWDDFTKKPAAVHTAFKKGEWNKYRIVAHGDHIRSWVNGVAAADFHDKTDPSGLIGLQVHGIGKGKGPYSVRWRNIKLHELKPGEKVD
jgi:hypothetical protein